MRKSKILATVVSAALIASVAASAAISANALTIDDIASHKVGIAGSFNNWGKDGDPDVEMTNNNGVWEGTVDIPEVTDGMVVDATTDDGNGEQISRGFKGITFKVRLDGIWTDSWGDYEPGYCRTYNSQTNCAVKAEVGSHVKIHVKLDTTKNSEEAINNPEDDTKADSDPDVIVLPVSYTVEEVKDEAPAESKPAEASKPAATKPATTTPAATTTTTEDTASPATGDTTSAVALVAVVLASLGTAVVMTKKASKE